MGSCSLEMLSRAERFAIACHRAELVKTLHREVPEEDAFVDWNANCRQQWIQDRHARMLALQREEILRHKWIESEKRHADVGSEAVFDWISRYAADWREWFEENVV